MPAEPHKNITNKEEFMELPMRDECKRKILRENAIKVFNLELEP